MALSSRELLLVLRARDEASRVLRGLSTEMSTLNGAAMAAARNQISAGSALVSLGVGMGFAGAAALSWLAGSTKEAIEFERQIALVKTQTDTVQVSTKELGDAVKGVANDVAVPIDQLTQGFYDIFSSMNVNMPQATHLLDQFAREAVAGQVDLQTASRATIGIMNAFHIPAEDVTKVLDVQFQLVRKGVGTFEQFAGAVGKATPAASRAGQSIETLSGMLAFLTRNGLSADMAASSAARAMEAFANPKVVTRLEEMGIKVKDAQGNFRDMGGVIQDLQKHLAGLTDPQRAAALQDLFKGAGGTIQARRFYDAVLKDQASVDQFLGLVGDMQNAQGAFGQAYDTMANTTASKSQLLENRWKTMRIEVGEALIPVFNLLLDWLGKLLTWWNGLSEGTQKAIVTTIAIAAAFTVLLGIVIAVAGAMTMLAGAAAMMGIGVGALLGIFALVVVAIAAVIAVGVLLWKNWDKVTKAIGQAWNWLFTNILKPVWDWIVDTIGKRMVDLWNKMKDGVVSAIKTVGDWVKKVWDGIVTWSRDLSGDVHKIIDPLIEWIVAAWGHLVDMLTPILKMIATVFEGVWTAVVGVLKGAWDIISGVVEGIIDIFKGIIDFIVGVFSGNWDRAWKGIKEIFTGVWKAIWGVLTGIWDAIKGIFEGFWHILTGIVSTGWHILVDAVQAVWDIIVAAAHVLWDVLVSIFWDLPQAIAKALWAGAGAIVNWASDMIKTVVMALTGGITDAGPGIGKVFGDTILNAIAGGAWGDDVAFQAGTTLIMNYINGMWFMSDEAKKTAQSIIDAILDIWGLGPKKRAEQAGKDITAALGGGMSAEQQYAASVANQITNAILGMFNGRQADYNSAGRGIAASLSGGLNSGGPDLASVSAGIAGTIAGVFGRTSLFGIGQNIMNSLIEGVNSKRSGLQGILNAITSMIPAWKGPAERDAKLLYGNGQLIMTGLIGGIKSRRDNLRDTLYDITNSMSGMSSPGMSFGPDGKPTPNNPLPFDYRPPGYGGGGMTQTITINTPEVVPGRDAAILGFELSRRVG